MSLHSYNIVSILDSASWDHLLEDDVGTQVVGSQHCDNIVVSKVCENQGRQLRSEICKTERFVILIQFYVIYIALYDQRKE